MAGSKKINKAKSREPKAKDMSMVNNYAVIADMDGNPNSPQEFDESHHSEGEFHFKADENATERRKNEVLMLNYIHQELHHVTERKVPVLNTETDNANIDVYHRVNFQGTELDVCVFWPPPVEGDYKSCIGMVKLTSDDLSDERGEVGTISTDAAWNADSKGDSFTMKNDKLVKNYWAPRWKYLVNALRTVTYSCYDRNGERKPEVPEENDERDNNSGDAESQEEREEREEPMSIFSGASGKIIGPKGAKIQEIKTTSGVKDIKMPAKNEDGTRPKARELVELTIIGKPSAIEKARELIQEVVDEWANAPRPSRDGGVSGGFGSSDSNAQPNCFTGGDAASDNFGGGDNWNNPPAGGGDWDTNGSGGGQVGGGGTGAASAGKKSEW